MRCDSCEFPIRQYKLFVHDLREYSIAKPDGRRSSPWRPPWPSFLQHRRVRADGDVETEGCVEWGCRNKASLLMNTQTHCFKDPIPIASSHCLELFGECAVWPGEHRWPPDRSSYSVEHWKSGEEMGTNPWGSCTSRHNLSINSEDSCRNLHPVDDGLPVRATVAPRRAACCDPTALLRWPCILVRTCMNRVTKIFLHVQPLPPCPWHPLIPR
jgi:hypothetical protein